MAKRKGPSRRRFTSSDLDSDMDSSENVDQTFGASRAELSQAEKDQNAKMAQIYDLGSAARDYITSTDRDAGKKVDNKKIQANRDCNKPGTAASTLVNKNKVAINAWSDFHKTPEAKDDTLEELEDLGGGQSHREGLQERLRLEREAHSGRFGEIHIKGRAKHDKNRRSDRPLDPAVDPDREYKYKGNLPYLQKSPPDPKGSKKAIFIGQYPVTRKEAITTAHDRASRQNQSKSNVLSKQAALVATPKATSRTSSTASPKAGPARRDLSYARPNIASNVTLVDPSIFMASVRTTLLATVSSRKENKQSSGNVISPTIAKNQNTATVSKQGQGIASQETVDTAKGIALPLNSNGSDPDDTNVSLKQEVDEDPSTSSIRSKEAGSGQTQASSADQAELRCDDKDQDALPNDPEIIILNGEQFVRYSDYVALLSILEAIKVASKSSDSQQKPDNRIRNAPESNATENPATSSPLGSEDTLNVNSSQEIAETASDANSFQTDQLNSMPIRSFKDLIGDHNTRRVSPLTAVLKSKWAVPDSTESPSSTSLSISNSVHADVDSSTPGVQNKKKAEAKIYPETRQNPFVEGSKVPKTLTAQPNPTAFMPRKVSIDSGTKSSMSTTLLGSEDINPRFDFGRLLRGGNEVQSLNPTTNANSNHSNGSPTQNIKEDGLVLKERSTNNTVCKDQKTSKPKTVIDSKWAALEPFPSTLEKSSVSMFGSLNPLQTSTKTQAIQAKGSGLFTENSATDNPVTLKPMVAAERSSDITIPTQPCGDDVPLRKTRTGLFQHIIASTAYERRGRSHSGSSTESEL